MTLSAAHPLDERIAQAAKAGDITEFGWLLTVATRDSNHGLVFPKAFAEAIARFPAPFLTTLLSFGANPNFLPPNQPFDRSEPKALPPLHLAARGLSTEPVDLLLKAGADPSFRDGLNRTALIVAASLGSEGIARALINAGSPLEATDYHQLDALHRAMPYVASEDPLFAFLPGKAASREKLFFPLIDGAKIARLLLAAGAPASDSAPSERLASRIPLPPLAAAIRLGDLSLAQTLIERGAETAWLVPVSHRPSRDPDHNAWIHSLAGWADKIERHPEMSPFIKAARELALLAPAFPFPAPASPASDPPPAAIAPAPRSPRANLASRRAAEALRSLTGSSAAPLTPASQKSPPPKPSRLFEK